jgi:ABC-2 type transport system ATP-binding protein
MNGSFHQGIRIRLPPCRANINKPTLLKNRLVFKENNRIEMTSRLLVILNLIQDPVENGIPSVSAYGPPLKCSGARGMTKQKKLIIEIGVIYHYYCSVIKISKLTKDYGKTKVLKSISLEIKKGEVLGFLGPNGAGKTTTLKTIVGLVKPTSGVIKIDGLDSADINSHRSIGYMPEDPYFYEYLSAEEFLKFIADLQQIPNDQPEIDKLLKTVGLEKVRKQHIREYSKGMRQRLGIAQALVGDPKILLLDEPLDGLDPIGRQEVKEILLDLKKRGKTILISSHILADIEELCDKVVIINEGKIIDSGSISKFLPKNSSLEKEFVKIIKSKKNV